MKTKKILIAVSLILVIALAVTATACQKTETDDLALTLKYASACTSLKVEMSKDGESVYVYDNGTVTDKYGLGIDVSTIVGKAGDGGLLLSKSDFKDGYAFEVKDKKATLEGKFADAEKLIGVKAEVSVKISADLAAGKATEYKVTYTDSNGYDITITLV